MNNNSIVDIIQRCTQHHRIVARMPAHFVSLQLVNKQWGGITYSTESCRNLVRLALQRLSGRLFIGFNNQFVTMGFEDPAELSFFILILPPDWEPV
jgi:hypothetical protein